MANRMTVARYDDAGGFNEMARAVVAITRTVVSGESVSADVSDRGDGTATVSASGPAHMVDEFITWVDSNY